MKPTRPIAIALALVLAMLGLHAAPAAAAPLLSVDLVRDTPAANHGDQRLDYTVKVSNDAGTPAPSVGDELTCANGGWNPPAPNAPEFSYQWLSNGAPATGLASGPKGEKYEVVAADASKAVQCYITATNPVAVGVAASIPVTVVDPQPSPAPLAAKNPESSNARPSIEGAATVGAELTCTAPTAEWSGTGLTWSLRWLVNGESAGPATIGTSSKYTIQAADFEKVIQCEATVEDGNVKALVLSLNRAVGLANGTHPSNLGGNFPRVQFATLLANDTSGQVDLKVELPGGEQTFAYKVVGTGWSCTKQAAEEGQNAMVLCNRADALKAEKSYPPLSVQTGLGDDAPDLAVARATASGGGSAPAIDEDQLIFGPAVKFGIEAFETEVVGEDGSNFTQAGGHPFSVGASFSFTNFRRIGDEGGPAVDRPVEHIRRVITDTPRGFAGNVQALPERCTSVQFVAVFPSPCPAESVIGGVSAVIGSQKLVNVPLYAIAPEFGTPAQFAFSFPLASPLIFTFAAKLRPDDNYAVSFEASPSPAQPAILDVEVTICDFGAKTTAGQGSFTVCKKAGEPDPDGEAGPLTGANPLPLITNPTRCGAPAPEVELHVDTWENPDHFISKKFSTPEIEGCEKVDFEPEADFEPTSSQADSPTGMEVELTMPTEGLEKNTGCHEVQGDESTPVVAECVSQANLKSVRMLLPEGMAVNASAGHGLQACTSDQIKLGTDAPISCPDGSKIGTVEIETPLLERTLEGAIYVAKQGDNPFGSLLAIYLVFESKRDGLLIKVAGRVTPDLQSGRLAVTFDENPEAPFSAVRVSLPQEQGSPLLTPPACGTYEIEAELAPWNGGETVTETSTFEVTSGPGGGPCPNGALVPHLSGGSTVPVAGQTTPFALRLHRDDGTQRFAALSVRTPKGLTAYLKDIPYCPEAAIASISGAEGTGQAQIDHPSCPAASQIGTAIAGAGAGPSPFYVDTGKVYLAGPYKGAPLSIAVVAPAVAGPLDLGNVVVRNAVYVDPTTAEITVVSDPVPHILHGLLLDVRDIRVNLDRPNFTLNPTSCEEKSLTATVRGAKGLSANEPGDAVEVSNRFQVGGCGALGFKPRVALRLFGGTNRGAYQGVRAVVRPRPGDANISRTVVRFPRSAFVAQEHIRTVCTRVQFAAEACPKGSIYGRAIAYSPLVDYPLRGNVYLRSSDNTLPDAVADLRGPAHQPVRIEVAIRNDSVKGALRNTVQSVPDAPVSYFRLQLFGKDKGLIVNSRNICKGGNRAAVGMRAHNGRRALMRPKVFNKRCAKRSKRRGAKRSAHRSTR